jgi:DNA-binding transcriptional regulator GbsR (MarR family)
MKTNGTRVLRETRARLIDVAGRSSQDLGLGRIVGQVLACVYLSRHDCALEAIAAELSVSKAAVSIAARQLEALSLLHRVWKGGDRRSYYRIPEHFGLALQQGMLGLLRRKLRSIGEELAAAEAALGGNGFAGDAEARFLLKRVQRASRLRSRTVQIVENPLLKMLVR